jgi:TolA-binding protein
VSVIFGEETNTQNNIIEYIQELTGKIDELTKAVDELQKRIEVLEHQFSIKSTHNVNVPTSQNTKESTRKSSPPANAERLWNDAICALQQKKLEVAEQHFADFIHFYPNHPNVPEGQYWLGEIQLLNKNYAQAQTYYALAYKSFPNTNTRKADAGLKIAECYFALKKNKEGCLFLKELMTLQQKGASVSTATLQLMEQYWAKYKCADL